MKRLAKAHEGQGFLVDRDLVDDLWERGVLTMKRPLQPRPVMRLDQDVVRAMTKVDALERTVKELPGLDCGSCGSPSCRTLAEDIVRGEAFATDCVFKLRERVQELAQEVLELARKVPPAMGQKNSDRPASGDSREGSVGR